MNSTHKAEIYKIDTLFEHTNSTNLEIVRLFGEGGYTCIVRKGQYKLNDLICYISPDNIVQTARPEFKFLDPKGEGKPHRVRVKKIRGIISQGLILPAPEGFKEGDDASDYFGVTRWEPPEKGSPFTVGVKWISIFYCLQSERSNGIIEGKVKGGNNPENTLTSVTGLMFPKYDIETLRKYTDVFKEGEPVYLAQKIHGSNSSYIWFNDQLYVRSRNYYKLDEDNIWARAVTENMRQFCQEHPKWTLWGEVAGDVKGFRYGCKNGEVKFFAFDIMNEKGIYLDPLDFIEMCDKYGIQRVPEMGLGVPFNINKILKMIEGDSEFENTLCIEGIVVKPMNEGWDNQVGRKFLKIVSDRYYGIEQ